MKLLVVAPGLPPDRYSGAGQALADLVSLARRARELRVVCGVHRDRTLVPADALAVPLQGLGPAAARLRLAEAALREVRRWRPDVVLSGTVALPPLGRPLVALVHDLAPPPTSPGRAAELWAWVRLAARAARVVTTSHAGAAALVQRGLHPDRVRVVPPGVDLVRFRPPGPRSRAAGAPLQLVHPGRILPAKGQHLSLDAVARLPWDAKRRAQLLVAGAAADPVYLDRLRVQAWEQPVRLQPEVPDMAEVLQSADLVLLPSIRESGFSTTAVEAMACGRAVIWADQPELREATGGVGVAVPPGDVLALRAAILGLMDDPAERDRLGAEGRRRVEAHLSREAVWAQLDALLEGAAG